MSNIYLFTKFSFSVDNYPAIMPYYQPFTYIGIVFYMDSCLSLDASQLPTIINAQYIIRIRLEFTVRHYKFPFGLPLEM